MKWEQMLPNVLTHAVGCPDQLAVDHLIKAARRFCGSTLVWNYSTPPIEASAGLALYTLQIRPGEELVRMLTCEVNGATYDVPSGMTGRSMQRRKTGNTCVLEGNNDFRLQPAPYMDGHQIITDVAVKPAFERPAEWPDDLEEFIADIAAGAISTLCALPNVTWRDDKVAVDQANRFADRIGTVAFKVSKGFGRSRHGAAITWY